MKAIWNNQVIAKSNETIEIEGNRYFPPASVNMEYLHKNTNTYTCPKKGGTCDYYNITVSEETNVNGAWSYPKLNEFYKHINGYFAFWQGVKIIN